MRRVWLIKAGDDGERIDPMRHAGLIGLRYEAIGDARQWSAEDIDKALTEQGHGYVAAQLRAMLLLFANEVTVGDIIVAPNPARREVWLGIVTGDYRHSTEPIVAHFPHTRTVEWLGWIDRDVAFMRDQLKSIERPPVLYELYSREFWWNQVDTATLSTAPRPAWSKPPPKRSGSTSQRAPRSTSPRRPAAPKPAPKPKAAAPVLCAGSCGLVWSPYVLVDGLCADCRMD